MSKGKTFLHYNYNSLIPWYWTFFWQLIHHSDDQET